MTPKISAALSIFTHAPDRYCPEGYREPMRFQERVALVSKIKGIKAVEVSQSDVTPEVPAKEMKRILKDYGLACSGVTVNLANDKRFAVGAFGHQHQKTRNAAIDEGRKAVDLAQQLGSNEVTVQLFSDGFDYPFHIDYASHWNTLISSIKTIAKYATNETQVAIAYKPRDPRKFLTVATVGKSLSLCQEIAMKNVGVSMNFSHAIMGGENPAESVAFLARSSKLFKMNLSDCHGLTDDLMPPGTVHMWELLEALFYLKIAKYKGYLTLDMLPQRIDPSQACQIAVGNLAIFSKKLDKLDTTELRKAQKTLDAVESQKLVRRVMLQS
jgi:xylose isomerase